MAGFKTHITTSCTLGVAYGTFGVYHGLPIESAAVAGTLCGIGGMLPDIDSDSGVPLREVMGFAAAVTPTLLLERFQQLGFNYEQLVLAGTASYCLVRFGLAKLLMKYTVHRGMFHSIPALLIFTGLAFLVCGSMNLQLRYFKAGGVFLGVLSHLVLDEIYAVDWRHARLKKSFGTALKLWGDDMWANFSTYGKLAVVVLLILGEPMVMERYGKLSPVVLDGAGLRQRLAVALNEPVKPESSKGIGFAPEPGVSGVPFPNDPRMAGVQPPLQQAPKHDQNIYDTARRLWEQLRQ